MSVNQAHLEVTKKYWLDYLPKKNSIIDFLNVKSGYFLNFALIIPKFEGKFPWWII